MKVYLQRPGILHDKLLGRVEQNGRVYRTYLGPDDEIGHVHLETGKVTLQSRSQDAFLSWLIPRIPKQTTYVSSGS